jgi:hypothetical protein
MQKKAELLDDTYLHFVSRSGVFLLKKTQPCDSVLILFNIGKMQERATNF